MQSGGGRVPSQGATSGHTRQEWVKLEKHLVPLLYTANGVVWATEAVVMRAQHCKQYYKLPFDFQMVWLTQSLSLWGPRKQGLLSQFMNFKQQETFLRLFTVVSGLGTLCFGQCSSLDLNGKAYMKCNCWSKITTIQNRLQAHVCGRITVSIRSNGKKCKTEL